MKTFSTVLLTVLSLFFWQNIIAPFLPKDLFNISKTFAQTTTAWNIQRDTTTSTLNFYYGSNPNTLSMTTSGDVNISGNYKFSSAGINVGAGTTFPTSPAVQDRFLRTDRNIWYYWDGTRWLSEQVFSVPITRYYTWGNTNYALMPFPWDGGAGNNKIYVINWSTAYYVFPPNSTTNYYTHSVRVGDTAIKDSFDSSLVSAGAWRRIVRNINNEWTDLNGYIFTYTTATAASATEAPGAGHFYSAITYRLIG